MRTIQQAYALLNQGRARAAREALQPLVDKPPSRDAEQKANHLMGACLVREARYEEAIERLRRAARLAPRDAQVRYDLGQTLYFANRLDESDAAARAALAINPNHPESLALQAAVRQARGEHEAAVELLDSARGRGVDHPALAIALAGSASRVGREPEAIEILERFASDQRTPPQHRQEMLFQIAALLERLKRHDDAFDAYAKANALVPQRYDPAFTTRLTDATIEAWTPERLRALPRGRDASRKPVFIIGMPRSGTTLVESILAAHPAVHAAGELMHLPLIHARLLLPERGPVSERLGALDEPAVVAAAGEYLSQTASLAPDAQRITDKHPLNYMHLGLIALLFPGASVIHTMRDPRDTCLSCYFRNFLLGYAWATDQRWIGRFYLDYERLMDHWRAAIPGSGLPLRMLEVRYEDIIADQEGASRRLLDFVGLDWTDEVIRFHEQSRPAPTLLVDQVGRPVYSTSVAKWRRYEPHIKPLLDALAPAIPDQPPPDLTPSS